MVLSAKRAAGAALERHQKIIFLEYLRCFAFISVLVSHLFPGGATISADKFGEGLAAIYNTVVPLFWNGGTGVYVFFLVSGYIITAAAVSDQPHTFLIRRIFRIYPLYVAAVIAQFYFVDGEIPPWSSLGPRLSLLGDFTHTDQVLNGVDWTLRIEIVFYAAMTIICLFPPSNRLRILAYSLLPSIALCLATPDFPNWSQNTIGLFNIAAPFLLVGCAVYLWETGRTGASMVSAVTTLAYVNYFYRLSFHDNLDPTSAPAAGFLFAAAWILRRRLPSSQMVVFVASLTYSVYLFHNWLFKYLYAELGLSDPLNSILSLTLMFIICWVACVVVEKPAIYAGKRIISALRHVTNLRVARAS